MKRRQIENYILDDDALFEAYKKIDETKFKSKAELMQQLFAISEEQFEQTVADYYIFKNPKDINPPEVKLKHKEYAEVALAQAFSIKQARIQDAISNLDSQVSCIRTTLKNHWKENWLIYCNGRNVLTSFSNKYGNGKSFEDIRDMVSLIWDTKKVLPQDLDAIIREVASS